MQDISKVLENVPDWKGLAGWLSIESHPIETDCAQDVAQASCHRRELVLRYCNRQPSENPCKVAVDIANELEKMNHRLQAQQLRNLKFGKLAKCNSPYSVEDVRICDSPTDTGCGSVERERASGAEPMSTKQPLQGHHLSDPLSYSTETTVSPRPSDTLSISEAGLRGMDHSLNMEHRSLPFQFNVSLPHTSHVHVYDQEPISGAYGLLI